MPMGELTVTSEKFSEGLPDSAAQFPPRPRTGARSFPGVARRKVRRALP